MSTIHPCDIVYERKSVNGTEMSTGVEHMGLGGRFGGLSVMRIAGIVFVVVLVSERPETKSGQSGFHNFTADP